ncbi:MAG: MBL fold metallo-hydrolase [Kordiimonadaceae bacterium]|nr:MBL fold metallo-hydrolase [Kordiimonadaceae bacterium]MBT7582197.1 MBL fold metallo-hydrolase [Kordiimonadaceae bacterium]
MQGFEGLLFYQIQCKSLVAALTDLPVSVLNSHTHYDHVGGNYQFSSLYGVASDYTAANAKGRTNDEVREFVGSGWVWKDMPNGVTVDNYVSRAFEISDVIADGEIIDLGGRELKVFHVPGHAPDAVVLIDREARLMWTGDSFYPATLYAHLVGSNVAQYEKSAERMAILGTDVDILLPSHNEPWVSSDYLVAMHWAFIAMQKQGADYRISDGDREYGFDGFTIMVNDPAPWEQR